MPAQKLSVVQEKGQITDKGVLISPQAVVALEALETIEKALKAQGLTLDDMMERGRYIRGRLVKEQYGLEETPKRRKRRMK